MPKIRIQLIASDSFVAVVDNWRRRQDDLPNRSEAIRRLVTERLQIVENPPESSLET
jgi:hypothetical protein